MRKKLKLSVESALWPSTQTGKVLSHWKSGGRKFLKKTGLTTSSILVILTSNYFVSPVFFVSLRFFLHNLSATGPRVHRLTFETSLNIAYLSEL